MNGGCRFVVYRVGKTLLIQGHLHTFLQGQTKVAAAHVTDPLCFRIYLLHAPVEVRSMNVSNSCIFLILIVIHLNISLVMLWYHLCYMLKWGNFFFFRRYNVNTRMKGYRYWTWLIWIMIKMIALCISGNTCLFICWIASLIEHISLQYEYNIYIKYITYFLRQKGRPIQIASCTLIYTYNYNISRSLYISYIKGSQRLK